MTDIQPRRFHPYDDSILRLLDEARIELTPSRIAFITHINTKTVQRRIGDLEKKGFVICRQVGNRKYCQINRNKFK